MAGSDYDRRLVTARDGTFKLWDLVTGKLIKEFGSYQGGIGAVSVSSDGTDLIYSDQKQKMYHQWDLVDFHEKPSYPFVSTEQAIRTNPDHKTTLVFTSSTGELTIWDRVSDKKTTKQLTTQTATKITFSTDGKHVAVATMQGNLDVYDVATLQRLSRVGDSRLPIVYSVFSPDGQRVLFENGWPSDSLQVWDIRTHREVLSLPHPANSGMAARLSPDGRYIALPFENGTYLWEAPTWEEIQTAEKARQP
jgi:WD40 repeat protein